MTLEEFVSKVPTTIVHKRYGHGTLKTLSYMRKSCVAWYYHNDAIVTGVSFGDTWEEVYTELMRYLSDREFVN